MLDFEDSRLVLKWQKLVDLLVQTTDMDAGYIVEPKPHGYQASLVSSIRDNPLKAGDYFSLDANIYCRNVLESGEICHIPDVSQNPEMQVNNPVYERLNFRSYFGYPLKDEAGETVATLCVLGNEPAILDLRYDNLFDHCRNIIESDIVLAIKLKIAQEELENQRLVARAVSHDLRNVMCITRGFADILESELSVSEETQFNDICYRITAATSLAERMLDNYSIWNCVKSDVMETEVMAISVASFVTEFRDINEVLLETKQLTLELKIDPACGVLLNDGHIIFTILANLLHNAIKFTPRNCRIKISADRDQNGICFVVADQGRGMSPELADRLFRGNVIASEKGTEGEKGTGLGNMICHRLSELIDATLSIMASTNEGTEIALKVKDLGKQSLSNFS